MRKRPGQFDIRGERERERKKEISGDFLLSVRVGEQLASHDDKFALSSSDFLLLPQHLVTISISFHFLFYPHGAFAGNGVKWIIESRQTTTKNRSHRSTKLRGTIDADCLLRPSRKSAAAEGKFPVITVRIYIKVFRYSGPRSKMAGSHASQSLTPDAQRLYYI